MVATPASLEAPTLHLDLPDPEQDDLSTLEFHARLEQAWELCDRFDLQTEIWRGRILAAVRDREKRGGEGRGRPVEQGAAVRRPVEAVRPLPSMGSACGLEPASRPSSRP